MKRLIVVRHAKAEKAEARGQDFDRPLAPRGEDDATQMGRRLARSKTHPEAIVASPAARTLATARLIARELDFPWDEIRTAKSAYAADVGTLLGLVRALDERAESALLVGHNPGITDLARTLVRGFAQDLPTCAVVVIDLPVDTWAGVKRGSGSLQWYDYPKSLG